MKNSNLFVRLSLLATFILSITKKDTNRHLDLQTFVSQNKRKLKINPGKPIDHDTLISSLVTSQINIRNFKYSAHQSYHLSRHIFRQFDQSVTSQTSGSSDISSLAFSSDGVFSTVVIPGDTNRKHLAILDTGSNDIVFPLPAFPATMDTFKTLPPITTLVQSYRVTFKCPSFIKPEFRCIKEGYVGVGYNSILGKDVIQFPDSNLEFNGGDYHTVFYFLNTLYGTNPNLAIIGIGFDESGLRVSSSLFEGISDIKNYEIKLNDEQFDITDAETVFPKLEQKSYKRGSFKTNVSFDRRQYQSIRLRKFISHISGSPFKGITIVKPSSKCTGLSCITTENENESITPMLNQNVILDSGTNGLILSSNVFIEFVKSIKDIADPELEIFRNSDKIYFICWVQNNPYAFLMDFGTFKLKVPLATAELIETNEGSGSGSKTKQCSYINLMDGSSMNILGYPYWKSFDTVFDGENMELHIKKGETCTGSCEIISS